MPRKSEVRDSRFHVSVICTGNICRSPMAAIVLTRAIEEAGLADRVRVTSAGTGPWHVGGPAHQSTRTELESNGYPTTHVARQIDKDELRTIDLVLAADNGHLKALRKMEKPEGKPGRTREKIGKDGTVKTSKIKPGKQPDSHADRIVLFRSLDSSALPDDLELPDPYGGPDAGYHEVMQMVQSAVPGIVAEIRRRLEAG